MSRRSRQHAGFTLIELMIVVVLIGVMATIAIPSFLSYQARSRRSEAFVNVSAMVRAQKSYFAEEDGYHDSGNSFPGGALTTAKRPWDAVSLAAFEELGWHPEGPTIYSYESNTTDNCNSCTLCFTATAYGDADSDGLVSAVMYVEPHNEGGVTRVCGAKLLGLGTPTRKVGGASVTNEVEINRQLDEF